MLIPMWIILVFTSIGALIVLALMVWIAFELIALAVDKIQTLSILIGWICAYGMARRNDSRYRVHKVLMFWVRGNESTHEQIHNRTFKRGLKEGGS